MELSSYLAKIIGTNMTILSLLLIFNPTRVKEAMQAIFENPGLLFIFGFLTLIFGTVLIVAHNVWIADWTIVVTIIGWIVFIRGVLRLYFPETMRNFTKRVSHKYTYQFAGLVSLIVGLFLVYQGNFAV